MVKTRASLITAPTAIVPASTLGAGVLYMPNEHLTIATQVVSATDSSFNSLEEGYNRFSDGQIWATSLMAQYRVRDLPGGFNATYLQWFNSEFTNIGSIGLGGRGVIPVATTIYSVSAISTLKPRTAKSLPAPALRNLCRASRRSTTWPSRRR